MSDMFIEPMPAEVGPTGGQKEPCLALGMIDGDRVLFIHDDGSLDAAPLDWFRLDYRLDPKTNEWFDPKTPTVEEDVDDDEE
jgi:hypothetical protein